MTKDEALKLALEALQKIYIAPEHEEYIRVWWPACEQAIIAIREALAQPEQEPFGYFRYDLRLDAWVQNREGRPGTPFYTTPPHRKPLLASDIVTMYDENPRSDSEMIAFARAIEAAHGIKENT